VEKERVLVVDDEAAVRRLLTEVCRREGYEVVTVGDGATALEILEKTFFPVCVVDLHMPHVDGLQVLRHIKKLYPTSQVIIFTAYGEIETAVQTLRLGAYDYLQKPLTDTDLIRASVSRALERWRLAEDNARLLTDLKEANQELERRRRQHLQYINYIGQAMGGALRSEDVTRVLLRAVLDSTGCDGAGVLILPGPDRTHAWALTDGRKGFSPLAQEALVEAMLGQLPEISRPDLETVELQDLRTAGAGEPNEETWRRYEFRLLEVRDQLNGVAVLASHTEEPFGEEAINFFAILVNQASIALANAFLFARTRELATRDGLTGLYNHRHFFELLEAEIGRAERHDEEVAIIMLDLDNRGKGVGLKVVNDTYGHQAGDDLLRGIGQLIKSMVRRADVVARYGGDEFIIMAPETGGEQVVLLARRVLARLYSTPFSIAGTKVHVTASSGAAVFRPGGGQTADSVVSLADRGLYLAKGRGGHQVCFVDSDTQVCWPA